ncbi:MAG: peptidyl-prolyl cis-trans isomerase SurA [Cyclobacteriaceae bacterium]|jgi:peptidyl-prolyl cis-trans isomerase SurA
MKRLPSRKILKFLATSIFCLVITVSNAQDTVNVDRIIAKVDDYIILKSDLEKAYLDFLSRGEFGSADMKCQILESLVINKMLMAKAEIDSVVVSDLEVTSSLQSRMNYMISQLGSEEELEKYYKKSLAQIEDELFEEMKEQMIAQRMQGTITSDIKITPSEVREFFSSIPRDSLPYFSTEVSVGQLVIKPEAGKEQQDKVFKQLIEIRGQLLRGEPFANLARQYSEDPGSASQGGNLPFYRRGELAPEFEAEAMTMAKGEVSMPIKTQFGYHLIELQEKRGNTFKSRHILITPKPSKEDTDKAERKLDSLRTLIVLDSITFRNGAKAFSDDQLTSSDGGFFSDQDGNTRVSVENLDPNVFFTIDTMKIGTVTMPLQYTEADGNTAFRILYYESKIAPHQANLKDDYQKIAQAATSEKENRILNDWFLDARRDVYIQVDEEYDYCDLNN